MSEVWIRADEAARGSVPARCAKTGVRCITRVGLTPRSLPVALEWATWTGLWPRRASAEADPAILSLLPRTQKAHAALAMVRDGTAIGILLAAVVWLLGSASLSRAAALALLALAGIKAVAGVIGWWWAVDVRTDVTGRWVRVSRVHHAFAAAVEDVMTRPDRTPTLTVDATTEPAQQASSKPSPVSDQP